MYYDILPDISGRGCHVQHSSYETECRRILTSTVQSEIILIQNLSHDEQIHPTFQINLYFDKYLDYQPFVFISVYIHNKLFTQY